MENMKQRIKTMPWRRHENRDSKNCLVCFWLRMRVCVYCLLLLKLALHVAFKSVNNVKIFYLPPFALQKHEHFSRTLLRSATKKNRRTHSNEKYQNKMKVKGNAIRMHSFILKFAPIYSCNGKIFGS